MGVMQKTKTITVDGIGEVTARELTAAQVDALMKADMTERPFYVMEALLDQPLLIEAVSLSTGLSAETLNGEITPTAAAEIWKAAAEVNDFLLRLMERLRGVAANAGIAPPTPRP